MKAGPHAGRRGGPRPLHLPDIQGGGFRLFFPLAAVYAALAPGLWVLALAFGLPGADPMPPSIWHAYEMLVGGFGAALIGFLTTEVPDWTDTEPMGARSLWALCGLWAAGRLLGVLDWSGLGALSALADLSWLTALLVYLVCVSWQQRTNRLLGFALWLGLLAACVAAAKGAALAERVDLASTSVQLAGFGYLGLLGLALARITVPVTNRILDSTQKTAPFRPNPGRFNLAPGLILVAMAGEVAGLSPAVSGFLLVAAGAAFMDRVGEHFVGRMAVRSEILMLAGAAALAGTGLMMTGAARLGAPWPPGTGLHVALMGGLGLGFFAVFCIAGLLQSGRPLGVPATPRLAALLIPLAVGLRVAPDLGVPVPGPVQSLVVVPWGTAFLLWLACYWPLIQSSTPQERGDVNRSDAQKWIISDK